VKSLKKLDPEVAKAIEREEQRSEFTLDLIASENYTLPEVMEATGSVMTNKYAEGYPSRRYYSGCVNVDTVENLARDRLKKIFGAEHANVQPHSGSQANMAVYFSVLNPGDTILGMNLAAGGHLTHGYPINFSGKFYNSVNYGVNKKTEMLDYDEIERLAKEHKPKLIICGASAYSQHIDFERITKIAKEIDAYSLADIAHIAGLIAAGLHPSPFPHVDFVTSTTHKTLRGPRGGIIMCKQKFASKIDKAVMPGLQGGPLMHHIAAKAVAFNYALSNDFKAYQKQVLKNAQTMADTFKDLGYRIVTNGTKNHLMVVDLRNKGINGKVAEETLEKVGIIVNRNCIPFDTEKPLITSGIRLGTPALTSRNFTEIEIEQVTHLIDKALSNKDDNQALINISSEVQKLCKSLPIYQNKIISSSNKKVTASIL
jgi:glycine hydroxymethyltransferase